MLENRDYMLHLFVCNPLIIHVKAVIYQLRVRAAFEASPSPIMFRVRLRSMQTRFQNR